MKTKRKIFSLLLLLCLTSVSAFGQGHWSCNPNDFQYDMTMYLSVTIDGKTIDPSTTELAAFVGNECRGVAEVMELPNGTSIYYLRVRSNKNDGEIVSFKAFYGSEEVKLAAQSAISFTSLQMLGMPSEPVVLEEQKYTPGDVNGDGVISPVDITLIISYYLEQNPANFIFEAADLNSDGEISPVDITLEITKYLNE